MAKQTASHTKSKPEPKRECVTIIGQKGEMVELIYNPALNPPLQFGIYRDGQVTFQPSIKIGAVDVLPPANAKNSVETGLVKLASAVEAYSSQDDLIAELKGFIHAYADVPPFWEELIAHYILMTWVYDRFSAVPYLRLLGEGGTGKSRLLLICSELAYKATVAGGSTTASPLFRLVEVYNGTLIMDEADYRHTDLWSDLIKVLNQGYMQGFPVVRSEKVGDTYEPRAYAVFGPKVIANRSRYTDFAFESRCLTLETRERSVRQDIPRQLPPTFHEKAKRLRNKLLKWRFDRFNEVQPDESKLLELEPRLAQIGTPIYSVATDSEFRERFLAYLGNYGSQQKAEKPQAIVVEALYRLTKGKNGQQMLAVKDIANQCLGIASQLEGDGDEWTAKRVGGILRSMGFDPKRKRNGFQLLIECARVDELVQVYGLEHLKGEEEKDVPKPPPGKVPSVLDAYPYRA